MSWLTDYKQDVSRYTARGGTAIVHVLQQQGLWALLHYRMAHSLGESRAPELAIAVPQAVFGVWHKIIEICTGISISRRADIGPGLYIGHFGGIIVGPDVTMGRDCNISQGVTIGVGGRGEHQGSPKIGNRVGIGANSVVAGKVMIGDDAFIAACSLVIRDVEPGVTVGGVPARPFERSTDSQ